MSETTQVKTKKRVADHGEVFTNDREVKTMLDLVKHETERIDSRFLEPACGTGNFLAEILNRKLAIVESRYSKSQFDFERYALLAVSSLYGVDILDDNVIECRKRLYTIFLNKYESLFKSNPSEYFKSIKFILYKNIIWGNALTLRREGLLDEPLIFSEWALIYGNMIQRRDFKMTTLLDNQPIDGPNLFSDLGDEAFIPIPVKKFPPQNLYDISEDVQNEL